MSKKLSFTAALNQVFIEEMERDSNIYMVAESAKGTVFGVGGPPLIEKFGEERVIDAPIAEAGYAAMAIGSAVMGKRPIVDLMFGDFMSLAYQAVVMEAAKLRYVTNGQVEVPVVFMGAQGHGIGGGLHHSNNVEGWILNSPGLVVVTPSTPEDAAGLMRSALRGKNPVAFLFHKTALGKSAVVPEGHIVPFGKADIVQEGTDVTVIASQLMRDYAEAAIKEVEKEGISVELIDPRTILPFDKECFVKSVKKTGRVVIVQEAPKTGGVAGEFATTIQEECFSDLKTSIKRVCGLDASVPYGEQEKYLFPSTEDIAQAIRDIVK